jgi:mono/diheme cytochrome c family protein
MDTGLRGLVEQVYRARGGKGAELPGAAQISGRGRVDLRFAIDDAGELYILTKPDGMIRKVVGAKPSTSPPAAVTSASPPASAPGPPATTPASIAAGKAAYDKTCAACHGNLAQGSVKAGITISIIEEQGGKQPPDLTDAQWDHGASDGEIYAVLKRGVPPTMMPGFDGVVSDTELWSIVNYLRTLAPRK